MFCRVGSFDAKLWHNFKTSAMGRIVDNSLGRPPLKSFYGFIPNPQESEPLLISK